MGKPSLLLEKIPRADKITDWRLLNTYFSTFSIQFITHLTYVTAIEVLSALVTSLKPSR